MKTTLKIYLFALLFALSATSCSTIKPSDIKINDVTNINFASAGSIDLKMNITNDSRRNIEIQDAIFTVKHDGTTLAEIVLDEPFHIEKRSDSHIQTTWKATRLNFLALLSIRSKGMEQIVKDATISYTITAKSPPIKRSISEEDLPMEDVLREFNIDINQIDF